MGWEINWYVPAGSSVLENEFYQNFSYQNLGDIDANVVKGALAQMRPDRDNSSIISYLSWILRVKALLA